MDLFTSKSGIKLDLGCGLYKQGPDWLGVDARKLPGVNLVHDLEVFPWPIPNSCAHTVAMSHLFEHIKPWLTLSFMSEIHRISKPDAQIFISGPYATGFHYVQDPTHCNPINEATFAYWDCHNPLWNVYMPPIFHVLSFERIPVSNDIDFAAILRVCKPSSGGVCRHEN